MLHSGIPMNQLLNEDKFHLSPKGTSMLAANLKRTLHSSLGIKTPERAPTQCNSVNNSPNRGRGYQKPKKRNWAYYVYGDNNWGRKH